MGTSLRSELSHDGRGFGSGFAWLSFQGLTVFSCYCRPGASLPEYRLFLGDLVEHTPFDCPYWDGLREALRARIGHRPSTDDVPDIICGPAFELLPADAQGKDAILREAEERFRLFYGMVENTLSIKEEEERVRQAANRRNLL